MDRHLFAGQVQRRGSCTPLARLTSPTITIRPPAATRSTVCSIALRLPVASITTGAPSPLVSVEHASEQPLVGRQRLGAKRARAARGVRDDVGATTRAPRARATSISARPIGPQPSISISSRADVAAAAGLYTDRHRLGERCVGQRKCWRDRMDVVRRRDHVLGEAAGTMHADDPQLGAAVVLADPAWIARAAADKRLDRHPVAGLDALYAACRPRRPCRRFRGRRSPGSWRRD